MNLRHLTARTAVAGVTTALAAGALVGLGAPAANAATVSNTYTCATAIGPQDATLTVIGSLPVPVFPAGAAAPADIVNVLAGIDQATAGLLASGLQATSLRIDDFAVSLGKGKVELPLNGPLSATAWDGKGKNKAFTTPDAGKKVDALMPTKLTVTVVRASGEIELPCTLKTGETPATLASIELTKQATIITAPKTVKGKAGKATKFRTTVAGESGKVQTGKLVVKEGKKTVGSGTIKNGKATVTVKKLKAGKHKLVLTFKGNGSFKAGKGKTTLVVKKKK